VDPLLTTSRARPSPRLVRRRLWSIMSPPEPGTPAPMQIRYLIFPAAARTPYRSGSVVEAQAPELAGVALPVFGDLDAQVQVDPGTQQRLDLVAGAAADVLQPCPA